MKEQKPLANSVPIHRIRPGGIRRFVKKVGPIDTKGHQTRYYQKKELEKALFALYEADSRHRLEVRPRSMG